MPCRECKYYEGELLSPYGNCKYHNIEVIEEAYCKHFSKSEEVYK